MTGVLTIDQIDGVSSTALVFADKLNRPFGEPACPIISPTRSNFACMTSSKLVHLVQIGTSCTWNNACQTLRTWQCLLDRRRNVVIGKADRLAWRCQVWKYDLPKHLDEVMHWKKWGNTSLLTTRLYGAKWQALKPKKVLHLELFSSCSIGFRCFDKGLRH